MLYDFSWGVVRVRVQTSFIIKDEVSIWSCFLICRQECPLSCLHRLTFLVAKRLSQASLEGVVCAASSIIVSLDAREVLERCFFSVCLPLLCWTCVFGAEHLVCLFFCKEGDVLCMVSWREDEGTLSPHEGHNIFSLFICSPLWEESEELQERSLFSASVLDLLFLLPKTLWDIS